MAALGTSRESASLFGLVFSFLTLAKVHPPAFLVCASQTLVLGWRSSFVAPDARHVASSTSNQGEESPFLKRAADERYEAAFEAYPRAASHGPAPNGSKLHRCDAAADSLWSRTPGLSGSGRRGR